MGRISGMIVLVLLALLCAGCFDYTEHLTINDDGSGTLGMKISMDKAYLRAIEKMTREMATAFGTDTTDMDSPTANLSRSKIEEALAETGEGVRLISFDSSETADAKVWDMKFAFDDINQAYTAMAALQDEEESDMYGDSGEEVDSASEEMQPEITFVKQADGTWLFERKFDDETGLGASMDDELGGESEIEEVSRDDSDDEALVEDDSDMEEDDADDVSDDSDEAEMDDLAGEMAAMMGDLDKHMMTFSVTFPGEIVESNATSVDGRTATWKFKLTDTNGAMKGMRAVIKK